MSLGVYNEKFFENHPEIAKAPGVLYCIVLVDKQTQERECLKIGIAKGKNWKDVIKRSNSFRYYDIRIQKTVSGTLEEVYHLEQYLHELHQQKKWIPKHKFSGHTECFEFSPEILNSIPNKL